MPCTGLALKQDSNKRREGEELLRLPRTNTKDDAAASPLDYWIIGAELRNSLAVRALAQQRSSPLRDTCPALIVPNELWPGTCVLTVSSALRRCSTGTTGTARVPAWRDDRRLQIRPRQERGAYGPIAASHTAFANTDSASARSDDKHSGPAIHTVLGQPGYWIDAPNRVARCFVFFELPLMEMRNAPSARSQYPACCLLPVAAGVLSHPAEASAMADVAVAVPKDAAEDDDFILECGSARPDLAVRVPVRSVLPQRSLAAEITVTVFLQRLISQLTREGAAMGKAQLKSRGY